ncbi:hypothetical protein MTO96_051551 [Rhipicephalus appendiculatus]
MPDTTYLLCGFASGLDWRPIGFKQRLQTTRVCSLCGIVPHNIAVLPCTHFLCESCLNGSANAEGLHACPLDKSSFEVGSDVSWITFHQKHMERLLVSCWNAKYGCNFTGPAGELLGHFEKHCSFHAITCSRCPDTVLRKDLPKHYESGCNGVASVPPTETANVSANNAGAPPTVDSRGRDLAVACSCHDMLTSIQGHVNALAESLDKIGCKRLSEETNRPSTSRGMSSGLDSTASGQDLTSLSVASSLGALVSALNETKLVVTEGFRRMERTVKGDGLRRAPAPSAKQLQVAAANGPVQDLVPPPSGLPEAPGSSRGRRVVGNGEATEEWFVFSVQYEPWSGETKYYSERKAAYHSISVNHEKTGVDIKCVVQEGSSFVAVYGVSALPASWKLSAVRPLRVEDMCSPYLRDWIFMRRNEGCSLAELPRDWRLRCVLETTTLPSEMIVEGGLHADFLVKLQRSYPVASSSETPSHA